MDWFTLTLISAFCLATADAGTKNYFANHSTLALLLIRFSVPAVFMLPLCFYFPLPSVPLQFYSLVGVLIILELGAMYLYISSIQHSPLHLTLPYMAFTPVFNIATGYLFLNEVVSLHGVLGIFLVVIGAYLLNLKSLSSLNVHTVLEPIKAFLRERGSRIMLGAAAIYSLTSVLSKQAMLYADPMSFGPFYFVVLGVSALLLIIILKPAKLALLKQRPLPSLTVGLFMAVMAFTHFLAIAQIEVAYMIAVKRTSLLFGIVYGAVLFKERRLRKNLIAGAIMVGGIVLIVN